MAITKVAQFASSPAATSDYEGQNAHINAFIQQMSNQVLHLTEWTTTTVPQIAQGVYLRHAGVLYIVDTAAFDIATGDLSGAGSYYVKLTTSGDSLAVSWEDTLTSYAWSIAYQGYYNGTSQLLPYKVVYATAPTYTKYSIINMKDSVWNFVSSSGVFDGINTDNATLKTKIVEIGDWNMDSTDSKVVAHGLTSANIRSIDIMIRNDGTGIARFDSFTVAGADILSQFVTIDATNVTMVRDTDGYFDDATHNSTSYNRGWITIVYVA